MANPWVRSWPVVGKSINKKTGKLNEWKVSERQDGSFGCTCPRWMFEKGEKHDCEHILKIKLDLMRAEKGVTLQTSQKTTSKKVMTDIARVIRFDDNL